MRGDTAGQREKTIAALTLRLSQQVDRMNRLTDAYIDRLIEQDIFETRKKTLLSERLELEFQISKWQMGDVGLEIKNEVKTCSFLLITVHLCSGCRGRKP